MKSVFAGVLILFFSVAGNAQEWPRQKPIQFVIGFGPGATTDTVARIAAQKLQEALGQSFVAENKPGRPISPPSCARKCPSGRRP